MVIIRKHVPVLSFLSTDADAFTNNGVSTLFNSVLSPTLARSIINAIAFSITTKFKCSQTFFIKKSTFQIINRTKTQNFPTYIFCKIAVAYAVLNSRAVSFYQHRQLAALESIAQTGEHCLLSGQTFQIKRNEKHQNYGADKEEEFISCLNLICYAC